MTQIVVVQDQAGFMSSRDTLFENYTKKPYMNF